MKKIYIVALIFAIMTGIAVYSFAGALAESTKREYTEVVVTTVDIPERTILTAEMLAMKSLPTEAVSNNAIKSIDQAVGLFTESIMETGEVLSSKKLYAQGEKSTGMKYLIPEGKRAFTVSVDPVSGVGGFILPGDHVDILATMTKEENSGIEAKLVLTSMIVLQNIEVLAAGSNITVAVNGVNVEYSTITLAVTPQDAVKLNLVTVSGQLRLILRSSVDKEIVTVVPVTQDSIE